MVTSIIEVRVDGKRFGTAAEGVESVGRGLSRALDKAAPKVSKELLKSLQLVAKVMSKKHGAKWRPGGSPRGSLFKRSGAGLKGIRDTIRVRKSAGLDGITGQIGARFPMSVHEKGATVRATRAQFLTIPLPAALNNRGIPRRRSARDWDNTFVAESKRGNLLIFQRRVSGIVPLYVLKKEVKIPARLSLEKTLREDGLTFFERRALKAIDKELDRA